MRSPTHTKTKSSSFTPVPTGLLQRKCNSCDRHTIAGGKCGECQNKRLSLQRRSTQQAEPDEVPPIVHEVLHSPSQPLDATTRAFMKSRLGYDFSQVRVHTDAKAAESARSVNALAYTVGRDVVFGAGQYVPQTSEGKKLIAHELTHTIQQSQVGFETLAPETSVSKGAAELEAETAAANIVKQGNTFHPSLDLTPYLARQEKDTTKPTAIASTQPMKRADFEKTLKERYRVKTIRTGSFQDQQFGDMKAADWHSWDPGLTSEVYTWIVEGFANFEKAFGGLPVVNEIYFFEADYRSDGMGHAIKHPNVLSSYALGRLTIYKGVTTSNQLMDITGTLSQPTPEQAVRRNIVHELGHGIAETALDQANQPPGADPALFKDYQHEVGWTAQDRLYDAGRDDVRQALTNGNTPPAEARIDKSNWWKSTWKERPLTSYMVDNPGDDFAEAVMAYVNEPQTLQALAPIRYKFLDSRKSRWLAGGQKINFWEKVKRGSPRTLSPSHKPNFWERIKETQ